MLSGCMTTTTILRVHTPSFLDQLYCWFFCSGSTSAQQQHSHRPPKPWPYWIQDAWAWATADYNKAAGALSSIVWPLLLHVSAHDLGASCSTHMLNLGVSSAGDSHNTHKHIFV
jgi:hypothetical protein